MDLAEAESVVRGWPFTNSPALVQLLDEYDRRGAELEECRRTRALGGPPPPVDKNWANADVGRPASADDPNAPAHRRDRNGGDAR